MAAKKKTAKKTRITKTKTTRGRAKVAPKKEKFRTFSTLSRVDAARKNRTLPRGTVVKVVADPNMRDMMETIQVKIGSPKKGTMIAMTLSQYVEESIRLIGFTQDDDAALPDFGTPVTAA